MNLLELLLGKLNLFYDKKTESNKIKKLFKKLLPFNIDIELIRVGENGDGGYLIPNDLKNIKYCYSAGIGKLTKFEKDLYEIYNIKSIMVDPLEIPYKFLPKESTYIKKFLLINDNKTSISINNFIDRDEEIILKIDIEGDEYLNLININNKKLTNVRILIIEFHNLRDLRSKFFFDMFSHLIDKLSKHFYFCHLHPNNTGKIKKIGNYNIPDIIEFTLINKNRVNFTPKNYSKLPNKLDKKIDQKKKDIFIDKNFYN